MISICLPVYNGERYLPECLDSILRQTFFDFEIVVSYDSSEDGTLDIIKKYKVKDPRIRLIEHNDKPGLVENWNRCALHARGEWIKYMFQDDLMTPNCLETFIKDAVSDKSIYICERVFIIQPEASDDLRDFYQNRLVRIQNLMPERSKLESEEVAALVVQMGSQNFIGEPTSFLFKRSALAEVGFFNKCLIQICDYEMALRLSTINGLGYIAEPLIQFRIHGENTSQSNHEEKQFRLLHIDPVIVFHQLLYDPLYARWRKIPGFTHHIMTHYQREKDVILNNPEHSGQDILKSLYPSILF